MALFLEAVNASGVVQRTPVNSPRVRIIAQQGFTYKLVDDQGARFDANVSIRRDRNSLLVDGLPAEQVVELDGFFFNCVPSSPCTFVTENLGGAQNITPASEPIGALQDGSFMMFTKGQLAAAVPVPPEAEFIPKNVLVGLGAVALLGVAAGGGGGGKSSGGSNANDTTPPDAPLLTSARQSKDARPVLTGTAEAGSIVVVSLDIDGNGVSDVSYEAQTDASGNWSIDLATATPSALALPAGGIPDGANVRIILRARDQANNTSTQATTEFLAIDRSPPAQTATITSFVDDQPAQTGSVAAGGSTNDLSPTLSGSISAPLASGDRIQVLRDGLVVGDASINGTLWSFTDTVAPGTTVAASYTARAADALGNGGTPSDPFLVNLDTRAPTAPTVAAVSTDDIINFTEAGVPVVLSGTAEAGSTLSISWGLRSFSALADAAGQWQFSVPANQLPGSGAQPVSVIATDAAGNSSIAGTRVVSIVTGLPSSPIINAVTGDNRINAAEAAADVTVSGLADPGNTISLTWAGIPGTRSATASPTTGAWSVTYTAAEITALPQGAGGLVATATDIAGNTRTAPAVSIDKDSIVPGQTLSIDSATDNQAPVVGAIGNGGTTNDQTPTINGSLGSALVSGDTIHVFRNGVDVGNATASGLSWSFTDTLASGGSYSYSARIIDAAGNLGTNVASPFGIALDITAPTQTASITSLADNVAPVTGNTASGGSGNDPTPTLAGTLSGALNVGESVRILRNGADIGAAIVTGLTWSFADSGLVSGNSYTYTARVQDIAGNQTTDSTGYVYAFDSTTPAPTINPVATNNIVNLAEATAGVTITGSVETGAQVAVTWGATTLTTTATGGTYSVNFGAAQVPANGPSTVSVVATDAAGNANTAVTQSVTIDRTAPALPTIALVAGDDIVSAVEAAAGVSISGTAETGSTVTVVWGATTLTQVASAGTYNLTFTAGQIPPTGGTTVTVTAQDSAGNNSVAATRSVTVAPASKTAAVTGITDDVPPVTGTVTNGAPSNDGVPTMNGTLSAALAGGETLHIYRNGVDVSGAGIAPGGTTWSFTDSSGGMVSGTTYTYTARVLDSASVAGPIGASFAMIFDNVSTTPVIAVVAGNDIVDFAERSAGVAVTGTAEAGSSVAVTWGSASVTGIATGGNYSVNFSTAQIPADGPSNITAVATDIAGNVSTTAAHALTIATTSSFTGTAGADTFSLTSAVLTNLPNPASVLSGAGGIDTFTFTGATALNLNLTAIGNTQVTSFERVDMTGGANNTLTLNASDVLAMGGVNAFTGAAWGGLVANGQTQLVIDGNTGDALTASGGWASAGPVTNSGVTYLVFNATSGASAVQLLVDTAITRTIT